PSPLATMRQSLAAIRHVESAVAGLGDGIALRYANLYGPGTGFGDAAFLEVVRKRRMPLVGSGEGVWSFVHVDDAAQATALAIERGEPGAYNVADDEPATAPVWLPYLARTLGAKPPRHVPAWVGRLVAGEALVLMSTQARGASNEK